MKKTDNKITLQDIIKLYNFRYVRDDQVGMYHHDTMTVRVYFDIDDWFEFGIYDFGYDNERDENVKKIITKKLLDTEVVSIRATDEIGVLEVHLKQ